MPPYRQSPDAPLVRTARARAPVCARRLPPGTVRGSPAFGPEHCFRLCPSLRRGRSLESLETRRTCATFRAARHPRALCRAPGPVAPPCRPSGRCREKSRAYPNSMSAEELLEIAHRVSAVVEDRRGQRGVGARMLKNLEEVLRFPGAARGDHRDVRGASYGAGESAVETGLHAIGIHRGE